MEQPLTWSEAQTFCTEQGGVLAYYDNEFEKALYVKAIDFDQAEGRMWLGSKNCFIRP